MDAGVHAVTAVCKWARHTSDESSRGPR